MWTKATVHVYTDSVLCLERMSEHSEANQKWKNQVEKFDSPILTKSYLKLMENQLSSRGTFSQDLRHWKFSERPRNVCKIEKLSLIILKIEPFSSCQCSMIWNEQRKEIQNKLFQIPRKSRITRRDSREDTGHSLVLETKRNRKELTVVHLKENADSTATQMVDRFTETGYPVFKSTSTLNRGVLKRKKTRDTQNFNTDVSNTELNDSLSKSALYLRSSPKSVRRVRSEAEREREDIRKVYDERK